MQQFRKTFIILLAIGFTFGFQSCKKDEVLTNTQLLTIEEGWTLESADGNVEVIADALIALYFQILPPEFQTPEMEEELRESFDLESFVEIDECDKDNVTIFKINGEIFEDQGSLLCEGSTPTVVNTWAFGAGETKLIITDNQDGEIQTFDITTLNESRLSIQFSMSLLEEMDEDDLAELEGLVGYDEFIEKDLVVNFHFRAN